MGERETLVEEHVLSVSVTGMAYIPFRTGPGEGEGEPEERAGAFFFVFFFFTSSHLLFSPHEHLLFLLFFFLLRSSLASFFLSRMGKTEPIRRTEKGDGGTGHHLIFLE